MSAATTHGCGGDVVDLGLTGSSVDFPLMSLPQVELKVAMHHDTIGGMLRDEVSDSPGGSGAVHSTASRDVLGSHHTCRLGQVALDRCRRLASNALHLRRRGSMPQHAAADNPEDWNSDHFMPCRSLGVSWCMKMRILPTGPGCEIQGIPSGLELPWETIPGLQLVLPKQSKGLVIPTLSMCQEALATVVFAYQSVLGGSLRTAALQLEEALGAASRNMPLREDDPPPLFPRSASEMNRSVLLEIDVPASCPGVSKPEDGRTDAGVEKPGGVPDGTPQARSSRGPAARSKAKPALRLLWWPTRTSRLGAQWELMQFRYSFVNRTQACRAGVLQVRR